MLGNAQTFIGVLITLVVLCLFKHADGNFLRMILTDLREDLNRYFTGKIKTVTETYEGILTPEGSVDVSTYNIDYWTLKAKETNLSSEFNDAWTNLKNKTLQLLNRVKLYETLQSQKAKIIEERDGDRYVALYLLLWGIVVMSLDALCGNKGYVHDINSGFLFISTVLSTVFLYKVWLYAIDDHEGGMRRLFAFLYNYDYELVVENSKASIRIKDIKRNGTQINVFQEHCHRDFFTRNGVRFLLLVVCVFVYFISGLFLSVCVFIIMNILVFGIVLYFNCIRKFKWINESGACTTSLVAKHCLMIIALSMMIPTISIMVKDWNWIWSVEILSPYYTTWCQNIDIINDIEYTRIAFVIIFTLNALFIPFSIYYYEHRRCLNIAERCVDKAIGEMQVEIDGAKKKVIDIIANIQKKELEGSKNNNSLEHTVVQNKQLRGANNKSKGRNRNK